MTEAFLEHFWSRVDRSGGTDACWPWRPSAARGEYGQTANPRGLSAVAHRVSWEIATGAPPPDHLQVCHSCDFPPCVNPSHLWLGTNRDNAIDCIAKNRRPILKRLFLEWRRKPSGRAFMDANSWALAFPEELAAAKEYVSKRGTWRDEYGAVGEAVLRHGIRYYEIHGDDPVGVPEDPNCCVAVVPGQGVREGLFFQCLRARKHGNLCTQHLKMEGRVAEATWLPRYRALARDVLEKNP